MSKRRTQRQGGFVYLTLDGAPARNVLSPGMVTARVESIVQLSHD